MRETVNIAMKARAQPSRAAAVIAEARYVEAPSIRNSVASMVVKAVDVTRSANVTNPTVQKNGRDSNICQRRGAIWYVKEVRNG
jgi:hypothetical protein